MIMEVGEWGFELAKLNRKSGRRECKAHPLRVFELAKLDRKSGRRDSNSRMVAWEATALPLGYARN